MEGLLPLVYKAIKKNRIQRQYEHLSSGSSLAYNPADFYVNDGDMYVKPSSVMEKNMNSSGRKFHRRSYSSVEDLPVRKHGGRDASPSRKQLTRFRSKRMFSCVTGC